MGWLRKVTVRPALMGIRSRRRRSRREEALDAASRTEGYSHGEIADRLGISEPDDLRPRTAATRGWSAFRPVPRPRRSLSDGPT